MAVGGERRSFQDASMLPSSFLTVAALTSMMQPEPTASKTQHHGNYVDEQTVPEGYQLPKSEAYKENWSQDYMMNEPLNWYNSTYPLNHNVIAYPLHQPATNVAGAVQGTKDEHTILARQTSMPFGPLDQFLDNSGFDYDQALDSLDLAAYENPGNFSLEDYANLELVGEQNDINFNDAVKQEKPESSEENKATKFMVETTDVNSNSDSTLGQTVCNMTSDTNDQSLDEIDNINLTHILDDFYPTPSVEWQTQKEYTTSYQPSTISQQFIKTEPDELAQNNCDFAMQLGIQNTQELVQMNALSCLPVSDEDLIQMPVSRFNELLASLTAEQSNLAKDIRRRGKNKKAARLCRKRKLDNISSLETVLYEMKEEKSRLLEERDQIVSETEELKRSIDSICEILMKGLNSDNVSSSSELAVLNNSKGKAFLWNN